MKTHPRLKALLASICAHPGIDQVAYLVPNLASAVDEWDALLGGTEWKIFTYSPNTIPASGFRGSEGAFAIRVALSSTVPQVELIEPLEGPSIYHEWIATRGHGLHHVGRFVPDIVEATRQLEREGITPVQWGRGYGLDGDGGFSYYEFGDDSQHVLELIEVPRRRRESEAL